MSIAYHGTNPKNAKSILREGFRVGTWFAPSLDDALSVGGPYVFTVKFSDDPDMWNEGEEKDKWQFYTTVLISPDNIIKHVNYIDIDTYEKLKENRDLMNIDYETNNSDCIEYIEKNKSLLVENKKLQDDLRELQDSLSQSESDAIIEIDKGLIGHVLDSVKKFTEYIDLSGDDSDHIPDSRERAVKDE